MADATVITLVDSILTAQSAPEIRGLISVPSLADISTLGALNIKLSDADLMSEAAIGTRITNEITAALGTFSFADVAELNGRITAVPAETLMTSAQITNAITVALDTFSFADVAELNGRITAVPAETLMTSTQISAEILIQLDAYNFESLADLNGRLPPSEQLMSSSQIANAIDADIAALEFTSVDDPGDSTSLNARITGDDSLLSSEQINNNITTAVNTRLLNTVITEADAENAALTTAWAWSPARIYHAIGFALGTEAKLNALDLLTTDQINALVGSGGGAAFTNLAELNAIIYPSASDALVAQSAIAAQIDSAVDGIVQGSTDIVGTAGVEIPAAGHAVYLNHVDNKWYLTDARVSAKSGPVLIGISLGFAAQNTVDGLSIRINGGWTAPAPSYTPGHAYYLSEAEGELVSTAPSNPGSNIRLVGYARSTTVLIISPDPTWVTVGAITTDIVEKTASHTLALSDAGKILEMKDDLAPIVLTIPDDSVAFPDGTTLDVVQTGDGELSIVGGTGSVLINGLSATVFSHGLWKGMSLYKKGPDNWRVLGGQ